MSCARLASPSPGRLEADRVCCINTGNDLECETQCQRTSRVVGCSNTSVAGATSTVLGARIGRSQEVTLRAVSAWTAGTAFSRPFERYVERVNETGKGVIKFNYLGGGAKIMNVFDMGEVASHRRIRRSQFHVGLLRRSDARSQRNEVEAYSIRRDSARKAAMSIRQTAAEKVNAHWVGARQGRRSVPPLPFRACAVVDKPDFSD